MKTMFNIIRRFHEMGVPPISSMFFDGIFHPAIGVPPISGNPPWFDIRQDDPSHAHSGQDAVLATNHDISIHIPSGWWLGHPSEKYESQLGWLATQYIWENKKWQPNHQPAIKWPWVMLCDDRQTVRFPAASDTSLHTWGIVGLQLMRLRIDQTWELLEDGAG